MTASATTSPRLSEVLTRLEAVRPSGDGWVARCPAHDDHAPSLSIGEGADGRVLVNCHAGCHVEDIVSTINLTMADLAPAGDPSRGPAQRNAGPRIYETPQQAADTIARTTGLRFAAWWVYHDARGDHVMSVVRLEPPGGGSKTFRPISRCDGGWRIGDPQGALPLYLLSGLRDADLVYVVEGERCADALHGLGLAATTSAHGAMSAAKSDWTPLAGKQVVILPDNDAPGAAYAEDVTDLLQRLEPPAVVRRVKLPDLPEHGDVVDFITSCRSRRLGDQEIRQAIERATEATSEESPEFPRPLPIPDELAPVMPFDTELLPSTLRRWIVDITDRTQCPIDFAAIAVMIALGSVIGRKLGIRPKRQDDWTVVANLWGAAIGRPGIMKTPAIQEALGPLRLLEIEAKEEFERASEAFEDTKLIASQRERVREQEVRKAITRGNNPFDALRTLNRAVPDEPPARRRYLVNDSTVEKLGELLRDNPDGFLVYRDELVGLLKSLDKEGQECARAFYLEAWNGTGRYTYDRIGRGTIDIESAIISSVGGIQPGPLRNYLRGAIAEGGRDDGLIQRFQLAVWPDVSTKWVNHDTWPDKAAKEQAYDLFRRLASIEPDDVGAGVSSEFETLPYLRFTPEAQSVFDEWRAGLELRVRSGDEHPAMESHLAKYRSLIPSLALVVHVAEGQVGPVSEDALDRAIRWGRYLETHAHRIYSAAIQPDVVAAKALAAKILSQKLKDGFSLKDVYRPGWARLASRDEAERAVTLLADLDWLFEETHQKPRGRPAKRYRINPRIAELPPNGTAKTAETPPKGNSGSSGSSSSEHPGDSEGTNGCGGQS